MRIKSIVAAVLVAGMGVTTVYAADGTHDARVAMMKKIGGATGALAGVAKGEKPYDAEAVKAALATISETAKAFPDQFKAGTENASADSEASPKIWENMDDFKARAAKLGSDADMLLAQLPADAAGVGAGLKTLGASCSGCHQNYRVKKE
ncbi:c-type cytochrome [Rhizobium metallidurans]|uniref:Cytochrome c556 n=1 Tax=Rhizobium metallidurans TaxID=1265931 RepID=A0A7W6GBD4_9HYPH|nr:cytochrome c [Rhizobium metallidurans]MBB3965558.1 cytochrome c556 [Rhizobium metallidurans]